MSDDEKRWASEEMVRTMACELLDARARVAELEAENVALKRSAAMACEEPCGSCAGCLYADDVHAREDAQGQEVNER